MVADDEFGGDVGDDAGGEVGRAGGVERDGDDSAEEAAEEDGDPLGGVVSPEDDAVAGEDVAAVELGGEAAGEGWRVRHRWWRSGDCRDGRRLRSPKRVGESLRRGWRDAGAHRHDSCGQTGMVASGQFEETYSAAASSLRHASRAPKRKVSD